MKGELTRLALCMALLAFPSRAGAAEPEVGTEISVLSCNIHGLFPLVAKDEWALQS